MKARGYGIWVMVGMVFLVGAILCADGAYGQDAAATPTASAAVEAADGAGTLGKDASERPGIPLLWYLAPICAFVAFFMAWKYYKEVMASDEGDADMIKIAGYVRAGAMAYLWRQYKVVAVVFLGLWVLLNIMAWTLEVQHPLVPWAFLTGGIFSGVCGFFGMYTATRAAHRTTAGARRGLNHGLRVAFRAGAVMGMVVVGFALIDITAWFAALYYITDMPLHEITVVMLTFGMGASTQALFARVGGGIFTKAADVGADLVGKVEAGIPEDDPRNPAAIADNVGDNVGDVAGMGADLYESYAGSILATAALGVASAHALGHEATMGKEALGFLIVPMVIAGAGIIASIWAGINLVKTEEGASMAQLMGALNLGLKASSAAIIVATFGICYLLLGDIADVKWYGIAGAVVVGLVAGYLIGQFTERYTSYDFAPTRRIAEQALTGPATVIIAGIAEGLKSTWASLAIIIVAIMLAFNFAGGGTEFMLGLYGVGLAAVGMLSTLGFTLATDAYGPIADNAGGNAEMTGQAPEVRERTDALDSLGNTTAATGKGFAIGSAALTALALLAAYVEEVRIGQVREAKVYIQSVVSDADTIDDAGLDEIFYMGHGKFASKIKSGTSETSYDAYMLLNDRARAAWDEKFDADPVAAKIDKLEPAVPERDSDYVQIAHITDGKGKQHEVQVVRTRKASLQQFMDYYNVTLMNPKVLCGMFSGVLLAFLFCALTMQAVGRAAYQMMLECRDQFKKIGKYLMDVKGMSEEEAANSDNWPREQVTHNGQKLPDYARCVDISTKGAQREMIFPSLLAIAVPVFVGLIFDVPGVMGLLAGGLTSGFAMAIFMANAGGAWDNAKKYIEKGNFGGKGSDAHKASIVGDTVGDPFKDTSGPSLNILIKLMSMVSVVFAGLVVKWAPQISAFLGLN